MTDRRINLDDGLRYKYPKLAWIFDLDGTLRDCTHRLKHLEGEKKDWDAFYNECHLDKPIMPMMTILQALMETPAVKKGHQTIFICSGSRESTRDATREWFFRQINKCPEHIMLRPDGDHRHDFIVKGEMLAGIRALGFTPFMAFEDRASVVKMWRDAGVPCAQVAEGDF